MSCVEVPENGAPLLVCPICDELLGLRQLEQDRKKAERHIHKCKTEAAAVVIA